LICTRRFGKWRQLEVADHRGERVVLRAIVDDDHLEMLVAQLQQCLDRRRDRRGLVVRRHDERDRHLQVGVHPLGCAAAAHVSAKAPDRDECEGEVDRVQQDEVAEESSLHGRGEVAEDHGIAASADTCASMSRA
jgi:hypothetical protein